jgi:GGDEF domain-containing protein
MYEVLGVPTATAADRFATAAGAAVGGLAAGQPFEVVAVSRMTDQAWTGLAARTTGRPSPAGRRVPVARTACHHLLVDHRPVAVADLRSHEDPALRSVAAQHGVVEYVGAALRAPDGRRLGSLCGWSGQEHDGAGAAGLLGLLAITADDLGRRLAGALDAAVDERRAAHERARHGSVDVTGLPDRRGWAGLLQEEDVRVRQLGEDLAVVLVDVGLVRTVRGIRRAGQVLREAVGDDAVSRVGGRQFGVLVGGIGAPDPSAVAADAQDALRAAGYPATSGWAAREAGEGAVGTWWRAEDALVRVRAGAGAG